MIAHDPLRSNSDEHPLESLSLPARKSPMKLSVLENQRPKDLVFYSRQSAQAFTEFCALYISESGAGNGYDAYWHYADRPMRRSYLNFRQSQLRDDLINFMTYSLTASRLCIRMRDLKDIAYVPTMGTCSGLITFEFDSSKLPARIKPQAGDMVRVIDSKAGDCLFRGDFRLIEISNSQAVIEDDFMDFITRERKRHTVAPSSIMKIFDYLTELREGIKRGDELRAKREG